MNLLAAISAHWKKLDRFDRLLVALPVLVVLVGLLVIGWESWPACPVDSSGNALVLECSQMNRNYGLMVGGMLAAVVAAFALFLNWRRTENDSKRLDGDAARLENDRRRIANDTYVKAIEQLGSPAMEVRLGAIYALERIAATDRDYHWPIMETLCAYIRERPASKWGENAEAEGGSSSPANCSDGEFGRPKLKRPPTDIQAILMVFKRRSSERKALEKVQKDRLNLSHVNWIGVDFVDHDFRGMSLKYAKMSGARFANANFESAFLFCANFSQSDMKSVKMERSDLNSANFRGACLAAGCLSGASLFRANLTDANLDCAYLEKSNLRSANLRNVSMNEANLSGADLQSAKFSKHPSELGAKWDEDDPPRNLNKIIVEDD